MVCLPTRHAGGALTVRGPDGSEVEFDFSADSQHVSWAAFYPDCLHEVAEVREGRRVTLTYNVYATTVEADAAAAARAASAAGEPAGEEAEAAGAGGSSSQSPLRIALEELARFGVVLPSRIQQRRQQQQPVPALASLCGGRGTGVYATLRSLVNNGAFLPLGGRVVFAAQHAYPVTVRQPARSFCPALLKGPDMLLAAAALALGLEVEVKLMVRKAEEWDSESGPDYHHHEAEVVALEDSDRYRGLPFYGEQQDDDDDTQETAWLQRQGVVEPPAQRDAPGTTVLVASEAAGSGGGGFADTGRAADARGHTQVAIATTAWGNESYVEVQYCCAAIVVRFPPPQERSGGSEAAAGAPPPLGVHNY